MLDRIQSVERKIEDKIVNHKNKINEVARENGDKRKMLAYLARRNRQV